MELACPNKEILIVVIAARHDPHASQSFNRLALIISGLQSVINSVELDQQNSGNRWKEIQVILADDYSPVPLASLLPVEILQKIKVLNNTRTPGQAGALNTILLSVPADVFAFTDSDCIVAQDWISTLREHYERFPMRVGVAGPNWLFSRAKSSWKRFLTQQEAALAHYIFASYVNDQTMTAQRIDCRNLSLRADFLDQYFNGGLFIEGSGPSVSGQASVNLRNILSNNGIVIGYEPKALTYHKPVDSLSAQVKAYYRWGRQGDYDKIYAEEFGSLRRSFLQRYLARHFIAPSLKGGVFLPYLMLVHGAYWIGIVKKHISAGR